MAVIDHNDVDTPSISFSIALGYSYSGYPRPFRVRMQGCRRRRRRQAKVSRVTVTHVTRTPRTPHGPIDAFIRAPPSIQVGILLQSRTVCEM